MRWVRYQRFRVDEACETKGLGLMKSVEGLCGGGCVLRFVIVEGAKVKGA